MLHYKYCCCITEILLQCIAFSKCSQFFVTKWTEHRLHPFVTIRIKINGFTAVSDNFVFKWGSPSQPIDSQALKLIVKKRRFKSTIHLWNGHLKTPQQPSMALLLMLTAGQNIIVVAWKWLNLVHILSAKANTYTRWLCVGGLKLHLNRTFRNKKRSIKRPIGDDVCVVVLTDRGVVSRTNFSSDCGSFHVCPSGCLALPYTTVSFIFTLNHAFFTLYLALFPIWSPERLEILRSGIAVVSLCTASQCSHGLPGSR